MKTSNICSHPSKTYRFHAMELYGKLTNDGQVDFEIPGGRVPEVHPAPVHALVLDGQVVDDQLRRRGGRAEEGPRPERVRRRPRLLLAQHAATDVEAADKVVAQWSVVSGQYSVVSGH